MYGVVVKILLEYKNINPSTNNNNLPIRYVCKNGHNNNNNNNNVVKIVLKVKRVDPSDISNDAMPIMDI